MASGRRAEKVQGPFLGLGVAVMMAILGTFFAVAVFFVALLLYNLVKVLRIRELMKIDDRESSEKCM